MLALLTVACGASATKSPAPASTVAPSPTVNLIDDCMVGAWTATVGMLPQTYQGAQVTATGGGGTVLTFDADGSYSGDFTKTQPYVATTTDGHRISVLATGAVKGSFTAVGGELSLMDSQTTLTVIDRVDGKITSSTAASSTSSAEYTCTPRTHLVLSSGGFATQYVPVG